MDTEEMRSAGMSDRDIAHERLIETMRIRFLTAHSRAARIALLRALEEAIRSRSPEAVAALERLRGL